MRAPSNGGRFLFLRENRKAGDEVSVTTEEGGSYTVRIKSITKEEDNGDGPIL